MPVLKVKNNDVWETISGASSSHTHSTNDILDFPFVDNKDNGKFMMVVDGKWAATTIPSAEDGVF